MSAEFQWLFVILPLVVLAEGQPFGASGSTANQLLFLPHYLLSTSRPVGQIGGNSALTSCLPPALSQLPSDEVSGDGAGGHVPRAIIMGEQDLLRMAQIAIYV
jgi:hypothetical protein